MSPSPSKTTRELERLQAAAQRHMEKGRTDKAVAAYRELARLEPQRIKHWLTIGYLEGKRGNADEAAAIYRMVGDHYESHGETAKAIAVYGQVLSPCPRDVAVHLKLAELLAKQERAPESWQHYRTALALLLEEDRRVDAVQVLTSMTELAAGNVALWIRLGETAVAAGLVDRAVAAFGTAMDLLRDRGRDAEYLRVAERLSGLRPDDLALTRELGARYLEQGEVAAALARLRRCIDADPGDVEALCLLVDAFLGLGDRDKAINALRLLADLHLDRGEMPEHALACQRLLSLDPSLAPREVTGPGAVAGGAAAASAAAPEAERRAAPQPAPEADPGPAQPSPAPASAAAPAVAERRGAAAGGDDAERGGESAYRADTVAALLKEAVGYARIGLYDGAVDVLRQARVLDPTHEEVFAQLRVAHLKLGSVDEAVELLVDHAERIVDRAPERATALLDEALELNADHPAVFRARIGPLDPIAVASKADAAASGRRARARRRWADETTGIKLLIDIDAVTVKRPLPPDVTVKINVDELERSLLEGQHASEAAAAPPGPDRDKTGKFHKLLAQPSSPAVFQTATTGEIDLLELRDVLGMDAPDDAD